MKFLCYPAIFLILFLQNNIQAQSNGKVDLKVFDSAQKPLDGIMVQLVKAKDSSMVQYAFTGQDGTAEFTDMRNNKYRVYIAQVGYTNYFSPVFTIDSLHQQLSIPPVVLQLQALKEVVVEGKTPMIQHYAGKTVVNVDQSPLNAVGSIYDVIQRSPGIIIDPNENIIMHGKQNVMVMIDGRVMPMSGNDLANYLKSIPSESVDKIEFITSPDAKYDANGTAGIINIVLKRNKAVGSNIALHTGYSQGIYPKSNDGFSITERTKKFNIFSSYNYSYRGTTNIISLKSNYYNNSQLEDASQQYETLKVPYITNIARIGADFFASKSTTLGCILDGGITEVKSSEATTTYAYDSLNRLNGYSNTNSTTPNKIYNYSGNFNLKHTFDSTGREVLINLDYANYNNKGYQHILTNYYNVDNTLAAAPSNLYGYLPGNLNIYSFKADYDGQLGSKGKLEAGIKSSYVTTNNSVMVYDGTTSAAPLDTTQSNHFIYSENINAAYVSYSKTLHKADFEMGLRAEQTIANGNQATTNQQFSHNFLQLFPTISIDDSIAKDHDLGIVATRRINRPTYDQLNPFRLYVNPTFYLQGNPYLNPQNAYSIQISDTYKEKYTLAFSYTHTINAITTVIFPLPGSSNIAEQTNENLNRFDTYMSNFSAENNIGKWLDIVVGADAFVNHYIANLASSPLNSERFVWDINDNNTITITKNLSLEIDEFYYSGYDLGYLFLQGAFTMGAGVKMNILNHKGTIKINANDIFWNEVTRGTTMFANFNQTIFVRRDTRFVGIAFTYNFGNAQASRSLRSKGGAEEEKNRANKTS